MMRRIAAFACWITVAQAQFGSLAYVKGGDVWVQDLPAGRAIQLTHDGRNHSPAWSASGKWLAYLKGRQVWIMHPDGSDAAQAGEGVEEGALRWSPTGDSLAATGAGVFRLDASGKWQRVAGLRDSDYENLVWSPDDRQLADEPLAKLVTHAPGPLVPALWSAAQILYWAAPEVSASIMADGLPLRSIPAAGGAVRDTGIRTLLHRDFVAPAPDGQNVALVEGFGRETQRDKRIAILDLATGGVRAITRADEAAVSPSWSPEGKRIAFAASPAAGQADLKDLRSRRIFIMNADGSGRSQLTSDPAYRDELPLWSKDGGAILFARRQGTAISLWMIQPDGSHLQRIVEGLSVPRQSLRGPDGRDVPFDWWEFYGHVRWDVFFDWRRG